MERKLEPLFSVPEIERFRFLCLTLFGAETQFVADAVLAVHEFRTVPVGEFIFEGVADVPGMWIFQEILCEGLFPTRTTLCSLYGCAFISIIEKTLTIGTEYQKYSLI